MLAVPLHDYMVQSTTVRKGLVRRTIPGTKQLEILKGQHEVLAWVVKARG